MPAQNDKGLTRTLQEFTLLTSRRRHFIPKALHANMFLVQQAVDVMDRDVMLLPGETSLDAFVRLPQHDRRVRHVVVTRDEKVVGVVRINTALHHGLEGTYAGVNLEDVASRHFAIAHPEEIMFGSQLGSSEIKYGVLILRNERDSGGFKNCKFSIPVAATKGSVW